MKIFALFSLTLIISACADEASNNKTSSTPAPAVKLEPSGEEEKSQVDNQPNLASILDAQEDAVKARYPFRKPGETLKFFQLEPGQTVLEALPGGGWYSKILLSYLGPKGTLVGVDYDYAMWPNFSFVDDAFMEKKKTWAADWSKEAQTWSGAGAEIKAYTFGTIPPSLDNSVDRVLFIRALHNLHNFEDEGGYLSKALAATHRVLKNDGLVGVVQHAVDEERSDEWADGSRGYLKTSKIIAAFETAGFTLTEQSDMHHNPKDNPGENDIVWRLPPTFFGTKENPEVKQEMEAVGESNRVTLLFKKAS